MPEEKNVITPEGVSEQGGDANDTPTEPTVQDIAHKMGWRPQEGFKGRPEDFKGPEEYILGLQEIKDHKTDIIRSLNKKMDRLQKDVINIQGHYKQAAKTDIATLKKQLNEAKASAIADANVSEVEAIDKQLAEAGEREASMSEDSGDGANPVFQDWQERNPWFGGDSEEDRRLTIMAKGINAENDDSVPLEDVLAKIDKTIAGERKAMATQQEKTVKAQTKSSVGSGSATRKGGGARITFNDLPSEAQRTAKSFERLGVMTIGEYLEDYAKSEGK